mgnify:CR=1 FL=1
MSNGDCIDYGIDFQHTPEWCPACWAEEREKRLEALRREELAELKRSNDIAEATFYNAEPVRPYAPRPRIEDTPTPTTPKVQRRGL